MPTISWMLLFRRTLTLKTIIEELAQVWAETTDRCSEKNLPEIANLAEGKP